MHSIRLICLLILMIGFIQTAETASYERGNRSRESTPSIDLSIKKQKRISQRKHHKKRKWDIRNKNSRSIIPFGTISFIASILFSITAIIALFVESWLFLLIVFGLWAMAGFNGVQHFIKNGWNPGEKEHKRALWALGICGFAALLWGGYLAWIFLFG